MLPPALRSRPFLPPPLAALALAAICAWLYLLMLGSLPFLGKDEPKNAEAAREMMARGDFVTPTLAEQPWFDKPILYYWGALLFFRLLGPGELAARLPCVLFAAGGVLLTWDFTRRLYDESTALRAGIILATCLEYFWYARTAVTDLPLTFFVTLTLVACYRAAGMGGSRRFWYPLAFAAAGGAALAKGPVGIVLPGLVFGSWLVFTKNLRELARVPWIASLCAFLAVAAPWYVIVSLRHGKLFWDDFIVNRNIERYTSTIHRHPGPVTYYLPILVIGLFPWGAVFPFAAGEALSGGWRSLREKRRPSTFLLLWILLPLLFFSFAGSKLPSYLLPCFPAMAILTARGWSAVLESPSSPRRRRAAVLFLVALFPVLAACIYAWCRTEAPEQIRAQAPLAVCLMLSALALGWLAVAGKHRWIFRACLGATLLSLTVLLTCSLANVREEASLTRLSRSAVRLTQSGATVVAYRNFHNYLYFYTENRVPFVKKLPELENLLKARGTIYCILEKDGEEELSKTGWKVEPVDRQYKVSMARLSLPDSAPARAATGAVTP